jgi:aryl-alcohol dehydrogenase-like predicted oxidoreductase
MRYRRLGGTDIDVSVLSLGTLTFGGTSGALGLRAADARRILDVALDAGVNLVDTADVYSAGESESIVGEIVAGRRDRLLLATKVGFGSSLGAGSSRRHILASLDASLRRLGVDHIDLYQLHGWDGSVPLAETLGALDEAVAAGKVRHIGCSNYSARQLYRTAVAADETGGPRFVTQQIYYSLLNREAERELIPAALDLGMSTLVWGPQAGGLLTGKYRRGRPWPVNGRHAGDWDEPPVPDWDRAYDVIEGLVATSAAAGRSPAQLALAALLDTPGVASLVVGARSVEQLRETLVTADLVLTTEQRRALRELSDVPLPYPFWHQAKTVATRADPADRVGLGLVAPDPEESADSAAVRG